MPDGVLSIGSHRIFNNLGDGIRVQDASTTITISNHTVIDNNGGWAINAAVPTTKIRFDGSTFDNAGGNFNPNANIGKWTAYVPAVAPLADGAGFAYVVVSAKYVLVNNKTIHWQAEVSITNNGAPAGSGALSVTLPTTCADFAVAGGRENVTTGLGVFGVADAGSDVMLVTTTGSNAYPVSAGSNVKIGGTYERGDI
jgi:hypothetical protein